jgi:hypothetical protein
MQEQQRGPEDHELSIQDVKNIFGNRLVEDEDSYNFDLQTEIENSDVDLYKIKLYLLKRGDKLQIGDIITLEPFAGYRNGGKLIYNGRNIKSLYQDIDDYGSVIPELKVISQFPIRYWEGSIHHNRIVFFDVELIQDQLDPRNVEVIQNGEGDSFNAIPFTYRGITYYFIDRVKNYLNNGQQPKGEPYDSEWQYITYNATPQQFINSIIESRSFQWLIDSSDFGFEDGERVGDITINYDRILTLEHTELG